MAMKVAKKSSPTRRTLTLAPDAVDLLDHLRGTLPKSVYLEHLLEREQRRKEDEQFYEAANSAYTPVVCEETLKINEEFPVHEK